MTEIKLESRHDGRYFFIRHDESGEHWHLYAYEHSTCLLRAEQDSLEKVKEYAYQQFGVPKQSWVVATFRKKVAAFQGRRFIIRESLPDVGWYLYALEGEKATHDYLQDTLDMAKECALEEFGVPLDAWTDVKNEQDLPKWCK